MENINMGLILVNGLFLMCVLIVAYKGYKQGLVYTLLTLIGNIVSIAGAVILSHLYTKEVYEVLGIRERIIDLMVKEIDKIPINIPKEEYMPLLIDKAKENIGILGAFETQDILGVIDVGGIEQLIKANVQDSSVRVAGLILDGVEPLVLLGVRSILMVILFISLMLIMGLLINILSGIIKNLPIVGKVDKLGGWVIGLFNITFIIKALIIGKIIYHMVLLSLNYEIMPDIITYELLDEPYLKYYVKYWY